MKKTIWLLALAGTACQQQKPPAQSAALSTPSKGIPAKIASTDALPPATRALLREHDLASLWSGYEREDYTRRPMEGFYGPPHYRISFYFSKVTRDSVRPNVFHVTGLDRYKKVITPFSGTITVHTLRPFTKEMYVDADSTAPAYTVSAQFVFNEDPATKGAGNYAGQALLDFYIDGQQHLHMAVGDPMNSKHNPARGSGLIFRGSYISNQTGRRKSVAFSTYYGAVVPEALAKLGLGDRSEEVNPNLARLGWNEAWENDEWWADSPKPSLNL